MTSAGSTTVPAEVETPRDRDNHDAALAAAGDTEAFARLVARWQDRMLGLAWRFCRDRTTAEDMAQDAFVRAFRALPRFRADAAFGTWLTAIALNTYRTALRDRPPVPVVPLLASHAPVGAAGQTDGVAQREMAEIVRAQVLRLPDRYRTAMVLYYFQEQNVAETARILGVRVGTLKGRLHRGRQLLERRLRFTARVMTAVRDVAAEEPPLPFPWARFAVGLAACVAAAFSIASFLSLVGAREALQVVAETPGVGEALMVAAISASVAQVFRNRARADF
jgi:RNA polymerase sigma-70 factor (ECF subfamily)